MLKKTIILILTYCHIIMANEIFSNSQPQSIFSESEQKEILHTTVTPFFVSKEDKNSPKKISLNFEKIDIRILLKILAEHANIQMIIDDTVKGNISISLNETSVNDTLNNIAKIKKLHIVKQKDVTLISKIESEPQDQRLPIEYPSP